MGKNHRFVRVASLTHPALVASQCRVATSFGERLRGLIGTRRFEAGQGMLFPRCKSVHTWWMSIPIDIVFLARVGEAGAWSITSAHRDVRPWTAIPLFDRHATEALELPAGTIGRCGIRAGYKVLIEPVEEGANTRGAVL